MFSILLAALFGLVIGSFLNVVILRLPVMMHRNWAQQCNELQKMHQEHPIAGLHNVGSYNLIAPRSHCPHCQHQIRAWENIPILSYVFLRGRCSQCKQAISIRYPLIELLTALLTGVVIWHFGLQWTSLFAIILTYSLIALAIIDFDHQLLPDSITFPMLWLGLLLSVFTIFSSPTQAIYGAVLGYLILWSVYWIFKLITKKDGMGEGDFKLLAMLGAWMGWEALPAIIFISACSGAIVGILLMVFKHHPRHKPIPFGPFLALAGWITLLWGDKLTQGYFRVIGI
ncbi:MAG: A24 family peptidase [Gammaproteobacteria bacterium]